MQKLLLSWGGESEDKIYAVIIPFIYYDSGLAWVFSVGVNLISYALKSGFVPIIDMQHHDNQYFKDGRKFKDNVWEYYFKQPCDVNLKDIESIQNNAQIRIFTQEYFTRGVNIPIKVPRTRQEAEKYPHKEIVKNFIHLSDEAQAYIDENYKKLDHSDETLGILCRGTDYIHKRPHGHFIPATPKMLIKKAREAKEKFNYKKIYVATEDLRIYNEFKQEFKDIMLPNTQFMYDDYKNVSEMFLSEVRVNRPNHNYTLGMEYLFSMFVLSKCKYFIASNRCGGLDFVAAFSNFYKDMSFVYVFDIGNYGIRKRVSYHNPFERIFSVKNEQSEDIVRKVLTLFGLKIKLKKHSKLDL